jgi:hypothetical protein
MTAPSVSLCKMHSIEPTEEHLVTKGVKEGMRRCRRWSRELVGSTGS